MANSTSRSTSRTPSRSAPQILSYRHLLLGSVEAFLRCVELPVELAASVAELVVIVSRYREEGASLFPVVFVCDDLERLLANVGGRDPIRIGRGAAAPETMRRALKHCASLGAAAWSVFLERASGGLAYGVFRSDAFVLNERPIEELSASEDPELRAVAVSQLAENVIELRGPRRISRYVYLSGARTDVTPTPIVVAKFARAASREVRPAVAPFVRRFYRHVLHHVVRASHGTLVAILPIKRKLPRLFVDGLLLEPSIDVVHDIETYLRLRTEDARAAVQGRAQLLEGMLRTDGITALRSDGSIVAYNVFVRHGPLPPALLGQPAGGARRRTFETLRAHVGAELVAAFYRSQDGSIDVAAVDPEPPAMRPRPRRSRPARGRRRRARRLRRRPRRR